MRVLHLINSIDPTSGGPANVILRLAPLQAARGHKVTIINSDTDQTVANETRVLQDAGITCINAGPAAGPLARSPHHVPAVKNAIAQGVDIAHLHGLWQHLVHWGASELRKSGVPYIVRPCGMLDPWSLGQSRLKKKLMLALKARKDINNAAGLHCTTQTELDLIKPLNLKPAGHVIPNGIDWAEFENLKPTGAFRASLGIDADTPLVLFLSRLHHKKGLDLLVPAFAKGAPDNAHLALVGPGEQSYVESIKQQVRELGIESRTHFPGMLRDGARLDAFADADLFALPSYQENFGVVVIEAGAAGTPVLISDQVNIHQDISESGSGRVIQCDEQQTADALKEMLSTPDILTKMGSQARLHAKNTYNWVEIEASIDRLYSQIVPSAAATH